MISNPTPTRRATHKLENNYASKVSPLEWKFWASYHAFQPKGMEGGAPRSTPPPRPTLPHPRTWLWRTEEFGHRNYTGLGGKQTLPFEGEYKVSCPPISRGKKAVTPWESQTDLPAGIGGSPAEVGDGCGSLWGQRRWQQKFWEVLIGMSPPGGHC